MKLMIVGTAFVVASLMLSGCASAPEGAEHVQREQALQEYAERMEQDRKARESERIEEQVDRLPDWVLEPPENGALGIYAVGSASSEEPVKALQKAKLKAEFALAQAIRQEISGQERLAERDADLGVANSEYELLVDRFVAAVPLKGHKILEQDVYGHDGEAQAHVLYRISPEALEKVLNDKADELSRESTEQAFEKLMNRVETQQGG